MTPAPANEHRILTKIGVFRRSFARCRPDASDHERTLGYHRPNQHEPVTDARSSGSESPGPTRCLCSGSHCYARVMETELFLGSNVQTTFLSGSSEAAASSRRRPERQIVHASCVILSRWRSGDARFKTLSHKLMGRWPQSRTSRVCAVGGTGCGRRRFAGYAVSGSQ